MRASDLILHQAQVAELLDIQRVDGEAYWSSASIHSSTSNTYIAIEQVVKSSVVQLHIISYHAMVLSYPPELRY
jgi:hypothetical protein